MCADLQMPLLHRNFGHLAVATKFQFPFLSGLLAIVLPIVSFVEYSGSSSEFFTPLRSAGELKLALLPGLMFSWRQRPSLDGGVLFTMPQGTTRKVRRLSGVSPVRQEATGTVQCH